MPGKSIILLFFLLLVSVLTPAQVAAQSEEGTAAGVAGAASMGVARMIEVKDKNIKNGTIVSTSDQGSAVVTDKPYDSQVIGVVSRDAAIIISSTGGQNSVPVISNGTVYILVSSQKGAIKKGDLLTTSTIPGVAVKADSDGYVLGTALEEYNASNPEQSAIIAAELDLHYFNSKPTFIGTMTDIFKLAILPTKDSPTPLFKYIVAAAVVLGSFVLGFMSFGRTAAKGVEALGRNPAASRIIHVGIIFNVSIVVIIVTAGLAVAFLILRL